MTQLVFGHIEAIDREQRDAAQRLARLERLTALELELESVLAAIRDVDDDDASTERALYWRDRGNGGEPNRTG